MIKGIVMGILLTMLVVAGGVYFYFATGMAPAATSDPPMPFEKKLANMALNAQLRSNKSARLPWRLTKLPTSPAPRSTRHAMRLVSWTARPVAHRLFDNHVSQGATVVPRKRCD